MRHVQNRSKYINGILVVYIYYVKICLFLFFSLLGWAAPSLAEEVSVLARSEAAKDATCVVANGEDLARCTKDIRGYRSLRFAADIECTSAETCCPGGRALIPLSGDAGLLVEGNGHRVFRRAAQYACPALEMIKSSNIAVRDLIFDEDSSTPPCELEDKICAPAISISQSQSISLLNITISDGKGYVVKVWGTKGFSFEKSKIFNAGIIGLYAGNYKYAPSWDVSIKNSYFVKSRTNAVAIDGVYASSNGAANVISGNVFIDNHWHGLWPAGHVPGGITPGGQLLIANGQEIVVRDNSFSGHPCGNCRPKNAISAIEIGDARPPPAGVKNLSVDRNVFAVSGQQGVAIRYNPRTAFLGGDFGQNSLFGYVELDDVPSDTKPYTLIREILPVHLRQAPVVSAPSNLP